MFWEIRISKIFRLPTHIDLWTDVFQVKSGRARFMIVEISESKNDSCRISKFGNVPGRTS
jgi:hypothetical protein